MQVRPKALPPKEAQAFWKSKVSVTSDDFNKLEGAARDRAFTVSGLSKLDQINGVQHALQKAIDNGETFADFKGNIGDILEQQGWTGKRAWRVENIFRTNMQSAYMAGRHAQMKRVAKSRPYWKLVAVKDSRTRKAHLAVDGLVFRHDHPFWQTWYPPNGFMCRCMVVTLSERQVKAQGLKVQTEMPDQIRIVDPDNGMESFITPIPDKGWANNVGERWMAGLTPSELDGELLDIDLPTLCRRNEFADDTCKPPLSKLDPRHIHKITKADLMSKGLPDEEYVRAFLKEFGIDDLDGHKVHRLPRAIPVVIDKNFFIRDKATGTGWKVAKEGREQYMRLLARTILDPFEVWETSVNIRGRQRPCLNLIRLFADDDGKIGGYAVFHLIAGRTWKAATAYTPKLGKKEKSLLEYLEKKRNGRLLHREELK